MKKTLLVFTSITTQSLAVIVFATFILVSGSSSCTENNNKKKEEKAISTDPPIKVSSQKLYDDYTSNSITADEKYLNHVIYVTGIVASVDKSENGDLYISLLSGDGDIIDNVICFVKDNNKAIISDVKKGMHVIIQGIGTGKNDHNFVNLERCTIEKQSNN